jgi:hypothetical protein
MWGSRGGGGGRVHALIWPLKLGDAVQAQARMSGIARGCLPLSRTGDSVGKEFKRGSDYARQGRRCGLPDATVRGGQSDGAGKQTLTKPWVISCCTYDAGKIGRQFTLGTPVPDWTTHIQVRADKQGKTITPSTKAGNRKRSTRGRSARDVGRCATPAVEGQSTPHWCGHL